MNGTIYMHRNKINNKVYIGQTTQSCQSRWKHDGSGYKSQSKFYNAIKKYGWDNFEHIILEENLTLEELNEREFYWIHFYNSIENGYNVREGGNNQPLTNEHKEKIRDGHNKTTAKKVICLNTLKVYNSIHEAMKETGSEHISDCCKKKIKSSGKDKNGNALIWRYLDEYDANENIEIKKQKRKKTKVICIETEVEYESAKEAERKTGINSSSIGGVCNGIRKTAGGFHWKWSEKNER